MPTYDLSKPPQQHFYLPMHGVIKESSSTTKLRVVFDASAKSSTGHLLNHQLLPGPSLYPSLCTIISKFRTHHIAITGDISKMFQGILLREDEKDFHRFLRCSSDGEMEDWRIKRLTFGVTSSPYLANKILHQAASDLKINILELQRPSSIILH